MGDSDEENNISNSQEEATEIPVQEVSEEDESSDDFEETELVDTRWSSKILSYCGNSGLRKKPLPESGEKQVVDENTDTEDSTAATAAAEIAEGAKRIIEGIKQKKEAENRR